MSRDLHVRVSDKTHAFLKSASDQTGLTMGHLVRQAVVEKYQPWLADFDMSEVDMIDAAVVEPVMSRVEEPSAGERATAWLARLIDLAVGAIARRRAAS